MSVRPHGTREACILVVEDNSRLREIVCGALRELGYDVSSAGNADDAVGLLHRPGFSLVVADIRLPGGLSGIDIAREAKRVARGTKVLVMGGDLDEFSPSDFEGACDATLAKPFTLGQLSAQVATLTGRPDEFACTENISRFVDQLQKELEPKKRATVTRLLIEEEDRYAKVASNCDFIMQKISEADRRIDKQQAIVRKLRAQGLDGGTAAACLKSMVEIRNVCARFHNLLLEKQEFCEERWRA